MFMVYCSFNTVICVFPVDLVIILGLLLLQLSLPVVYGGTSYSSTLMIFTWKFVTLYYRTAASAPTSNLTELKLNLCDVKGVIPGWISEIRSLKKLTVTLCNLTELAERFVYVQNTQQSSNAVVIYYKCWKKFSWTGTFP